MENRTYLCIDLKSFYASVECVERGLNPLTTNLVVADSSRTEKTICLAVSPTLKAYGIPGRARLFEVIERVRQINALRKANAPGHQFSGSSSDAIQLKSDPSLSVDYIIATPRMAHYMEHSTSIYNIYLKYIAPEDIHVYSIDEVFIDLTSYLKTYHLSARELAMKMIHDVLHATGITATAGIGTNLYLAKVAMDIFAKKIQPDKDGVRIAELDELTYRKELWAHQPITDFWRVGHGYAKKLQANGIYTMGDIARCSIGSPNDFYNEELLYKLFGINAELLIDHAWGWEPCTMALIKAYKPENTGVSAGQVLSYPYSADKARIVVWEMADNVAMDLFSKKLTTDQLTLTIGYDKENLNTSAKKKIYQGEIKEDRFGRQIPKHAHGSQSVSPRSASSQIITATVMEIFDRIVDPTLTIRRIGLAANHLLPSDQCEEPVFEQIDLFSSVENDKTDQTRLDKEKRRQEAVLTIRNKYGKNAIFKGQNLTDGATSLVRSGTIGGHKA